MMLDYNLDGLKLMLDDCLMLYQLQTLKFLYGCAVSAMMVKAKWLTDSIAASSLLPPERYALLMCKSMFVLRVKS